MADKPSTERSGVNTSQPETNKSVLNDSQRREFTMVNELLVARGLSPQSESDFLQAIRFNVVAGAAPTPARGEEGESKKIVISPDDAERAKRNEVEEYRNTLGEIYIALEQELDKLSSDQQVETSKGASAFNFDLYMHAKMLSLLDSEFNIFAKLAERKAKTGFHTITDTSKAAVTEKQMKAQILKEINLDTVVNTMEGIIHSNTPVDSSYAANRKTAAKTIRTRILNLHQELAA